MLHSPISLRRPMLPNALAVFILATVAFTYPTIGMAQSCDIAATKSARALHETLSRLAVEAVRRAASANWVTDQRLLGLVAPEARISLGAGDVGRPLGTGTAGLRELAKTMHADTYRFLGWDYMDGPAEPCGTNKVSVEFIDTAARQISRVDFTFNNGQIVEGEGWARSFEAGSLR